MIGTRLLARLRGRMPQAAKRPSGPAGKFLQEAQTIAFIAGEPREAEKQGWIGEANARGAEVDVLPLSRPYRRGDGKIMSFVYRPPRDAYECIVVNRSIDLFEHSWSYAFLDRLNSLLSAGGTIWVPRRQDATRHICDERLAALFGRAPREAMLRYLAFEKAPNGLHRPPEAALSTLDAYWPLMDELVHGNFDARLADVIVSLGASRVKPPKRLDGEDLVELVRRQSYRTCSACTKAAMVGFLVATFFPGRDGLHLADLGAGTAMNSLELLLGPSGISSITLVEPFLPFHWDIAAVYDGLGGRVRGKVSLVDAKVEIYAGAPVDIAMVCAVFSVMPGEKRSIFARGAWDNLAPGGILVVLENMLGEGAPGGAHCNATRCTPSEIDAMLGQLAPIRYFPADAMRELRPEDVGNATVFRVVRKPG